MQRRTLLTPTLLAAAALSGAPAGAAAAPAWSSPAQVLPAAAAQADVLGLPSAFLTGQGASLVLGANADGPHLASGDAAGRFGKAVALAGGPAQSTRGDLGADGTFAAAWGTNGTARAAILRPGQAPAVSDLPGGGANAVDVAVAPDGTVTVAWRTKTADSSYALHVASAAPGGGFGEPATLTSGRSAISGIDVDAGPDGAVAVVVQKGSPARTHASFKPAGGTYEALEPLGTGAGAASDLAPQVEFSPDGSAVAAWPNPVAGAQAAIRPAGAAAFAEPVTLGPAGEGAYTVDLTATPQGGTAVAWDGGGPIRATARPAGGAFDPSVQVFSRSGAISSHPSVGVSPDGTVEVLHADPETGAVRIAALGAPPVLLGHGKPSAPTATDLAVGAAGRAVAVWQDAQGGLSAATRSDQVAPGGSPGQAPGSVDRTAPRLSIVTRARVLKLTRRATTLRFDVRSDEAGTVRVLGALRTTVKGKRRTAPLTQVPIRALKAGRQRLTVKLNASVLRDLRRAFKAGRRGELRLEVSAKDTGGYETRRRVTFFLAQKKAR